MIIASPMTGSNDSLGNDATFPDLDTSPDDLQLLLSEVGERIAGFVRTIGEQPTQASDRFDPNASWLDDPLPQEATPAKAILDLLFNEVIPCAYNPASPGYLAYVPGGGIFSAALGELVAGVVNRYTGLWISAPGPVELETQALRWLAEVMGMPEGTLGVLTSGTSTSTLLALIAAREKHLGDDISRGVVYASNEVHHSALKAPRIAGIPASNVRTVDVDEHYRLRVDELERAISEDRDRGLRPFFVCASAGTVNTGTVDPLDSIANLCAREKIWFHVDGAYGGAFRLVPELEETFRGMERADSVAMDPHKGLFLAYGTGALLVRDLRDLRRAFSATGSYMPGLRQDETQIDFCEHTNELSREWRGLRLWLPFKLHGIRAFRESLKQKRRLALRAYDAIRDEPDTDVTAPPDLSLFAFRQRFEDVDTEEENRRNRALLERINSPRRFMLTGTEIAGVYWLRVCVLHMRTRDDHIDGAISVIRDCLQEARS